MIEEIRNMSAVLVPKGYAKKKGVNKDASKSSFSSSIGTHGSLHINIMTQGTQPMKHYSVEPLSERSSFSLMYRVANVTRMIHI